MSSFKGVYQNFLASPSAALLNDEASLHYITTLTTINSAAAVVKHFEAHQKILKKTEEKALNSIEGDNAICLVVVGYGTAYHVILDCYPHITNAVGFDLYAN